ncbi:pyrroline-5-carboxylate reductase [Tenacibaculum sp. SG-28]|uniref:pyrroline-5-carboxylate reductase n=1 Tax=Tenacibaculum sp. SG-28 TaxID=754426 RepID=UPI000CF3F77A|nr:pyrroline-5-carboxylate reductase [Tenacibaculum sp. SG-28]PQJ23529.1 pyrroline-5-carboxylate reductase [Tenacibaculum sp. SG-28]
MKIAIIGTGNLGKSIAMGLLKQKAFTSLYLTKRNLDDLREFKKLNGVVVTENNLEAVQNSAIIIFAVQPRHFENILASTCEVLSERHCVISTITGFSIAKIEAIIGTGFPIFRVMPNTAIAVEKSMTCISANSIASPQIAKVEAVFKLLGHTVIIPENKMQAATVVCASGIAFWMRLIRASSQAAIQLGFDAKEAQDLAMFTCEGTASLLIANGNHPEEEIDKVTTPKGCTIAGLNAMENFGLSAALIQGMVTSFEKINSIKKEQI